MIHEGETKSKVWQCNAMQVGMIHENQGQGTKLEPFPSCGGLNGYLLERCGEDGNCRLKFPTKTQNVHMKPGRGQKQTRAKAKAMQRLRMAGTKRV